MTIFAMQPTGSVAKPYRDGARRVEEAVSPLKDREDEVAEAVAARLSSAGEMLAVEVDGEAVRWEKVAELRSRIAAGVYRVSAEAVAEKMMNAWAR